MTKEFSCPECNPDESGGNKVDFEHCESFCENKGCNHGQFCGKYWKMKDLVGDKND